MRQLWGMFSVVVLNRRVSPELSLHLWTLVCPEEPQQRGDSSSFGFNPCTGAETFNLRVEVFRSHWVLMGFECLAPPGSSANPSFGSCACSGPGLTRFNPRGKSSLMPARRSLAQSRLRGGKWQRRVRTEGPVRGQGRKRSLSLNWKKRSLSLNWFGWLADTVQLSTADSAHRAGLSVTQRQRDHSSWLQRWVCCEEERNSLIYLGHWMVPSATGCEQPQLQLLADGFCKSQNSSSPAPTSWSDPAGILLLRQCGGVRRLLIKFFQCSCAQELEIQSLLGEFSIGLSFHFHRKQ